MVLVAVAIAIGHLLFVVVVTVVVVAGLHLVRNVIDRSPPPPRLGVGKEGRAIVTAHLRSRCHQIAIVVAMSSRGRLAGRRLVVHLLAIHHNGIITLL